MAVEVLDLGGGQIEIIEEDTCYVVVEDVGLQGPSGGGGGSSAWGSITGTLSNQTDLQSALDAKEASISAGTTSQYWRGDKSWQTLDKSAVGLSNVDNTSDINKPISTATQTALDAKQAADSDLTTIAGLTPTNDDFLQYKSSAWANRTISQVKTDLGLTGTNSGDQTITLTGDVTGSGTGSFAATVKSNLKIHPITLTIDGAGSAITTGTKAYWSCPYDCTIQSVTMLADVSGSAVVDIWKDTYANYPPTDADSITASAVPTISAATKSTDATLAGWTTSISAGDILAFNVDSASTITKLTLVLGVIKT